MGGDQVPVHETGHIGSEWIQLRKTGIGGSDVAAVAGVSSGSVLQFYLEKTGELILT